MRGTDLDLLCIHPAPPLDALSAAVSAAVTRSGYTALDSINDVKVDVLQEWCEPGERCVAITGDDNGWRRVYDTEFGHTALVSDLAGRLEGCRIVQVNVQESTDLALRILDGTRVVLEYSAAPEHFAWGRTLTVPESAALKSLNADTLAQALGRPALARTIEPALKVILAREPGVRHGPLGRRKGGVSDAIRQITTAAGLPPLYRFFEGWMRSDLDWDEDGVETVLAFRRV